MRLSLKHNLPFVTITVAYKGSAIDIPNVLVDTGSGTTIVSSDVLASIQIMPAPEDTLYTIRGVGGSEAVFARLIDYVRIGERSIADFEIQVGGMDYGFQINGILGMDFLTRAGAIINLQQMTIEFASS